MVFDRVGIPPPEKSPLSGETQSFFSGNRNFDGGIFMELALLTIKGRTPGKARGRARQASLKSVH